jgi:bifunctional non-homologous end joining protein LigD
LGSDHYDEMRAYLPDADLAAQPPDAALLQQHYAIAAPFMERLFGPIPFVWATAPRGLPGPRGYHGPLSNATRPKGTTVDVVTPSGTHRYPQLSADRILHLVPHGAIEFHSWSPTPQDPTHAAFARLIVSTTGATRIPLPAALLALRSVVNADGLDAVLVFDGERGAALWVPFADAPAYDDVRASLHQLCLTAAQQHPDLLTTVPNTTPSPQAHLHISSNAVGRFSILPYSTRARPGLPLAVPVVWNDVTGYANGAVCAGALGDWLAVHGETFSAQLATIPPQRFGARGTPLSTTAVPPAIPMAATSRGPIIATAIAVLQDGSPYGRPDPRARPPTAPPRHEDQRQVRLHLPHRIHRADKRQRPQTRARAESRPLVSHE